MVRWVRQVSPAREDPVILAWNKVSSLHIKKGLVGEKTYPEKKIRTVSQRHLLGGQDGPKPLGSGCPESERRGLQSPHGLAEAMEEFRGT